VLTTTAPQVNYMYCKRKIYRKKNNFNVSTQSRQNSHIMLFTTSKPTSKVHTIVKAYESAPQAHRHEQ